MDPIRIDREFTQYLYNFEDAFLNRNPHDILWKDRVISVRESRLKSHAFGQILGTVFEHPIPCAFDYYGLQRKSTALIHELATTTDKNTLVCSVLNFQSVKVEDILNIDSNLIQEFAQFKATLLKIRGFK